MGIGQGGHYQMLAWRMSEGEGDFHGVAAVAFGGGEGALEVVQCEPLRDQVVEVETGIGKRLDRLVHPILVVDGADDFELVDEDLEEVDGCAAGHWREDHEAAL